MLIRTLTPWLISLFLAPLGFTEEAPFVVNGARAKEFVAHLSTHEMEGRKSCTPGYQKAAEWCASMFESWGLEPAGDNNTYFQQAECRGFDWNVGVPQLSVNGRKFYLDDKDFSLNRVSTPGAISSCPVVFAGYGISAPDKGLDEYKDLNVEGKIVLVFKGSPFTAPAARRMFSRSAPKETKEKAEDPWKEESKENHKIKTAYKRGAAGLMIYDPNPPEDGSRGRYYGRRSKKDGFKPDKQFLCFSIEERIFRAIMKQDPQETPRGFSKRMDNLRRSIKDKIPCSFVTHSKADLRGYDSSITYSKENKNISAPNVLAKIEGCDPQLKDQYVIVGAHLDHLGVRNGYVYNGADDNASGSGVVLEVARVLKQGGFQPKRTLIFACWCGEELGLCGSRKYTSEPCDGVSMDRVVAYFNMDMVGLGDSIRASGGLNFPSIWEVIIRDQDPELMKIVKASTGGAGGSDHSGFIEKGIEALALMTSGGNGHPYYHQPEDDTKDIDPDMLQKTGQFVVQGMMNLANETETTLLIPDRLLQYKGLRMRIANYNPDLQGSRWSMVKMEAKNKQEIRDAILAKALTLIKEKQKNDPEAPRPPRRSNSRGVCDLGVFEGDLKALKTASDFYAFARLDIKGDDGHWIKGGRLTDLGRKDIPAMEEAKFTLHLISPSEELINDFLSVAAKPFLITGQYELSESIAETIAEKGVLLGVDLDPKKMDDFLSRLEKIKDKVGKRELLVIYLTSAEGLDEVKKPLYMSLIKKGWSHKEICGNRRRTTGLAGGNFNVIGARSSGYYYYR